jgi:hypothetical protein
VDWPVVVVVLVLLVLVYAWWLSRRIDRLNARTGAALDALEDQLGRRAAAALALSAPAASAAREAAAATTGGGRPDTDGRQAAENDLVRALRQLPGNAADDAGLRAANRRLGVARQVYNDAVRDTRALRTARVPRMFFLGRRLPLPEYFDVDELDLDAIDRDRRVGQEKSDAAALASQPVGPPPGALASQPVGPPPGGVETVRGVGEAAAGPS